MESVASLEAQLREEDISSSLHLFAPGRLRCMTDLAEAYPADPIAAGEADLPAAFQNADLPLTEAEDGRVRQGEGDNCGSTCRIAENWYRCTADF